MAFQPVLDTAEIDVIYTYNGVIVQNSFYAKRAGGYVLSDLQALADAVDLQVGAAWLSEQPAEAIYVRTEVRGLALPNDIIAEQNLSAGPGTEATAALPNNVTFSIKKTSGLTGRSARGRTYWIGMPSGKRDPINENLMISAWAVLAVAAVGAVRTIISTVGVWQPVLVSRFTEGAARPSGVTFPWTGETNIDLRVDTLRGRLPEV